RPREISGHQPRHGSLVQIRMVQEPGLLLHRLKVESFSLTQPAIQKVHIAQRIERIRIVAVERLIPAQGGLGCRYIAGIRGGVTKLVPPSRSLRFDLQESLKSID